MSSNSTGLPEAENLTDSQIETLVLVERIGGAVSLVSVMLIFLAYGLVRRVRNVQNTFIVFASVANIGASVGSIIAFDGIEAGQATALCQAQSFLFEMFMQSDPWWSLAMAINVFLVFYFHTNPDSFRKLWWVYCIICYGGPFVIALSLLLVRSPDRGLVYGGATIWCWVGREWDYIRIYTYYMLVWICIVGSLLCYFLVGYHVFRMRNQLRSFSTSRNRDQKELDTTRAEIAQQGYYGTRTTEVQVIHSLATTSCPQEPKLAHLPNATHISLDGSPPEMQQSEHQFYSSITTSPLKNDPPEVSHFARFLYAVRAISSKFHINDPIKRAYLRTSFLFAISVLVTWIPSSLNRIHGWLDGESPYEFHVATAAVLPLQGLWNAVIFFVTSWRGLKSWVHEKRHGEEDTGLVERQREDIAMNARIGGPEERSDTSLDDGDSATGVGSDVELRRMSTTGDKASNSL